MLQPCFCPRCVPRNATRNRACTHPLEQFEPFRVGAPIPGMGLTSSDNLLELWVPLTRRDCQNRPVPSRGVKAPSPATRYQRAVAFLYRCLMIPDDIPALTAYMAKPQDAFDHHDMEHPDIDAIRRELLAPRDETKPAFLIPGEEPWRMPAMHTVNRLTALLPPDHILPRMARKLAKAHAIDHPVYGHIVRKAIVAPNPRGPWPWVPGWHPASFLDPPLARSGNAPDGWYETLFRPVLREWWNFNAHLLRPDAFETVLELDRHATYVDKACVIDTHHRDRGQAMQQVLQSIDQSLTV